MSPWTYYIKLAKQTFYVVNKQLSNTNSHMEIKLHTNIRVEKGLPILEKIFIESVSPRSYYGLVRVKFDLGCISEA